MTPAEGVRRILAALGRDSDAAAPTVEELVEGVKAFVKRILELDPGLARSKDACRSFEVGWLVGWLVGWVV